VYQNLDLDLAIKISRV